MQARRPNRALLVLAVVAGLAVAAPARVAGFSGFGPMSASEQYGTAITFSVDLPGGPPQQLDLLLDFGIDPDSTFVAAVQASGSAASYTWDASQQYLTPNTPITYRWRATNGTAVTESPAGSIRYADNRPGLDWHSAQMGDATIHWYGSSEAAARRFGDLTGGAVSRAEKVLGHTLDGPVDIFVYVARSEFFGALGPGAREWTGAATFPSIRTVFMWLGGGSSDYLDRAIVHEVTHVVFYDATRNVFHAPPLWLNEGFAVWSERQNADEQAATVRSEVSSGLISFSAMTDAFPIGTRGSSLSYAEGATMVDRIIHTYGASAMSGITAAYRNGATDDEALRDGTGVSASQLYADYFRSFGASEPKPIPAATIGPSIVHTAAAGTGGGAGTAAPNGSPAEPAAGAGSALGVVLAIAALALVAAGLLALFLIRRRRPGGVP
jgi:hypothetical protein